MSGLAATGADPEGRTDPLEDRKRLWWTTFRRFLLASVLTALVVGGIGGVVWKLIVTLPYYSVGNEGAATTTERMLTDFVAPDAWYAVVAAVGGLIIGLLALRFVRLGWPAVVLSAGSAVAAGLICWGVGVLMGPNDFNKRLANAMPGDQVPIDFTLEAQVAIALWPFAAVIPLLLWSSLAPDTDSEPSPTNEESDRVR